MTPGREGRVLFFVVVAAVVVVVLRAPRVRCYAAATLSRKTKYVFRRARFADVPQVKARTRS